MMMMVSGALALVLATVASAAGSPSLSDLRSAFSRPPDDSRIMMRWWWFGPAITRADIARELGAMKDAGIGGVEIQTVYPLALDDPAGGIRNLPYLGDDFLDVLAFAASRARTQGLRVDVTLGNGWPFGGPHIPVARAAGRLRVERVPIASGDGAIPPWPALEASETPLQAFRLPGDLGGPRVVLFFIAGRTGQQVKRPAVGGEGFVLDHYDRSAVELHLEVVGNKLLHAFGDHPPHAVFSDSLEVFGSGWTGDLLPEFRRRRGYDLAPHLPALITDAGGDGAAVRHDWAKTLTELAEERYLAPIRAWAEAHGTRLRSQTYGTPPVSLSSNALVDLPEGEGAEWRAFSAARWASSASHLYGRAITSSETWTWLHSPAFRATPLDMKAEADRHFLQGINQLIGHGWPHSPEAAGRPGWRFYAAAALNDHNPWWPAMPRLALYLQRVSHLMRQGAPVRDVALYLPTADARARLTVGREDLAQQLEAVLDPQSLAKILDAGFGLDFIDDEAIERVGISHTILILPRVQRMPLATYRKIEAYSQSGGIVVATVEAPSLAPGLAEASHDTPLIRDMSRALFERPGSRGRLVRDVCLLGKELAVLRAPDFSSSSSGVGFVHRHVGDTHLYFVANTENRPVHGTATVRVSSVGGEWWDAVTGKIRRAAAAPGANGSTGVALDLAPYESRILVLDPGLPRAPGPSRESILPASIDISTGWKVTFVDTGRTVEMSRLRSWTEDEPTRFYSGQALYQKIVRVPASFRRAGRRVLMDFGPGTPVEPVRRNGFRAWFDGPVREAAVVDVNGRAAGVVWLPPYEVDITELLRPGDNQIRILVGNLAINALAGRPLPDYRLLEARYGKRFAPQDFEGLAPVAAGLFGPIRLVSGDGENSR